MPMMYRALRRSFLFEMIVGLVTLLGVLLLEQAGIALSALLVFRPWVAGGRRMDDQIDEVRRIYRDAFRIAIALTTTALTLAYLSIQSGVIAADSPGFMLILLAFPLFMLVHGLTGYLRSSDLKEP